MEYTTARSIIARSATTAILANIASLANYTIADDVIIENVGTLKVVGSTSFGNGVEIDVLNEAGGRTLKIFDPSVSTDGLPVGILQASPATD